LSAGGVSGLVWTDHCIHCLEHRSFEICFFADTAAVHVYSHNVAEALGRRLVRWGKGQDRNRAGAQLQEKRQLPCEVKWQPEASTMVKKEEQHQQDRLLSCFCIVQSSIIGIDTCKKTLWILSYFLLFVIRYIVREGHRTSRCSTFSTSSLIICTDHPPQHEEENRQMHFPRYASGTRSKREARC